MQPPIGIPRCYDGSELPILYPGEVALPQVAPGAIEAALAAGLQHGTVTVQVTGWLVEPTPGWRGWWLRTRYRCWGRWCSKEPPKLVVSTTFSDNALQRVEGDDRP